MRRLFFLYHAARSLTARIPMASALPVMLLLFAAVMWGLTWWPLKTFNAAGVAGVPLILLTYGVVGLLLSFLLWRDRKVWRGHFRLLWLIGLLGGYANLAFATAMIYGDVVRAMMLFYLAPVWGVLGGRLFLGEVIDRRRWLGVVLAIIGAWLILGGNALFANASSWVDLLALTAGMAFAMNNITFRATAAYPNGSRVAAVFVGCGLFALLLMPFQTEGIPHLAPQLWFGLAIFSLLWLLGATFASAWAVSRLEAGRASILMITELLVAVISATLIGDEALTITELVGGTFIIMSAVLEALRSDAAAH
jgi:drug/metabolite transporter (DMT)-like permease